jgi:tRNA-splicing ligase RtcB (3'-phosphate/5'-hydroxy nucleic acid ligase)
MQKDQLVKLESELWEIPIGTKPGMRVSGRIYASEIMIDQAMRDRSFDQLINVTTLPGIQRYALVMPDVHEGYGFPIGAVAAIDLEEGVISPGGIGYDINCGIRLLKSDFDFDTFKEHLHAITSEIYKAIPSGMGKRSNIRLGWTELDVMLNKGCRWAEERNYTEPGDLEHIESHGSLPAADATAVSKHSKERGYDQLGTMGGGNHFVEIDVVDEILDETAAKVFGIFKDQIVIQIHTGSRGLGHQVATDYVKIMLEAMEKYNIQLPDRELSCAPIKSPEGQQYFGAMCASANFAWTNRQLITYQIRKAWRQYFGSQSKGLSLLYDVAHNIAKIEEYQINNEMKKVMVHRKGATRAFQAGNEDVPTDYRSIGQPVLIPGSMGTASYILVGLQGSMENSFGSTCHGSGRALSRTAALKQVRGDVLKKELNDRGIDIQSGSMKGLAEEAPQAYKDVESVVDVVSNAGIAGKVARLKPLGVIKG